MQDPLCGFIPAAGLIRDMLTGITYIQKSENLFNMEKSLPVLFVAGGDDPVGDFGNGVRKAADAFRNAGMEDVSVRIYPLCRHEILNEMNSNEVYSDILAWVNKKLKV
jgi:alpha-beta hydrolase superfamily lysophospholipase